MDIQTVLLSIKKSNHGSLAVFADGAKLMAAVKKKGAKLSKGELKRFRGFIKLDGNNKLLTVKDESYTAQKEMLNQVADEMAAADLGSKATCYKLANEFLKVCTSHYENLEKSQKLEAVSADLFERKIREDKRFKLLENSHNPFELYELGEVSLKTEDFFNPAKADEYYTKAAELGLDDGYFTLGLYYELDEKDFDKAKSYYDKLLANGNPKGWSGLAILAADEAEGNPYYDLAKAQEYAQKGYDLRCGTSIFLLSQFYMDSDRPKAFDLALEASQFDGNLEVQLKSCENFVASIVNNMARNFPAFAKALSNGPAVYREMIIYLYASKYNMARNYGRFLASLNKLADAIVSYFSQEQKYSKKQVLSAMGITKELAESLAAQYATLDEATASASAELINLLA